MAQVPLLMQEKAVLIVKSKIITLYTIILRLLLLLVFIWNFWGMMFVGLPTEAFKQLLCITKLITLFMLAILPYQWTALYKLFPIKLCLYVTAMTLIIVEQWGFLNDIAYLLVVGTPLALSLYYDCRVSKAVGHKL